MKKLIAVLFTLVVSISAFAQSGEYNQLLAQALSEQLSQHMVKINSGSFIMGNNSGFDSQKPAHEVTVSAFEIGKTEVTEGMYKAVMGTNPSCIKGGDNYPVECVSWYDAIYFCNKLSIIMGYTPCYAVDGVTDTDYWNYTPHNHEDVSGSITCNFNANGYRLPTEAEWEYAAVEEHNKRSYNYSDSSNIDALAWYYDNSGRTKHEVATKSANAIGLYDMIGNVYEWCWDFYNSGYYASSPEKDPTGPATGFERVFRGGCFYSQAENCRAVYRPHDRPGCRLDYFGFRLVRSVQFHPNILEKELIIEN